MYGGKPGAHNPGGGTSRKGSIGLEAKPGDRGDTSNLNGCSGLKSNKPASMPTQLKSECSEGYETVNAGWHGNVKR